MAKIIRIKSAYEKPCISEPVKRGEEGFIGGLHLLLEKEGNPRREANERILLQYAPQLVLDYAEALLPKEVWARREDGFYEVLPLA